MRLPTLGTPAPAVFSIGRSSQASRAGPLASAVNRQDKTQPVSSRIRILDEEPEKILTMPSDAQPGHSMYVWMRKIMTPLATYHGTLATGGVAGVVSRSISVRGCHCSIYRRGSEGPKLVSVVVGETRRDAARLVCYSLFSYTPCQHRHSPSIFRHTVCVQDFNLDTRWGRRRLDFPKILTELYYSH